MNKEIVNYIYVYRHAYIYTLCVCVYIYYGCRGEVILVNFYRRGQ